MWTFNLSSNVKFSLVTLVWLKTSVNLHNSRKFQSAPQLRTEISQNVPFFVRRNTSSKTEHNLKHTGSILPSRTNAVTLTNKLEMAATTFSITPWMQQLFESPLLFPKKKGKAFEEGLCAVQLVYGDHPENGTFLHFTYHPVPDRSKFWVEKKWQ